MTVGEGGRGLSSPSQVAVPLPVCTVWLAWQAWLGPGGGRSHLVPEEIEGVGDAV